VFLQRRPAEAFYRAGVFAIGTTAEQIDDLLELVTTGHSYWRNLSSTSPSQSDSDRAGQYSVDTLVMPLIEFAAGETAMYPLKTNVVYANRATLMARWNTLFSSGKCGDTVAGWGEV